MHQGAERHLATFWYNPRDDRGPIGVPASTYVDDGVAQGGVRGGRGFQSLGSFA